VYHGDVHKIDSKVQDGCVVGEKSFDYLAVNKMFYRLSSKDTSDQPGLQIMLAKMLHLAIHLAIDDMEDVAR
jgi:hypothetical protein